MIPYGVSEFTTWPWSFERDIEVYPRTGAHFIEICEFKLNRNDYAPQLRLLNGTTLQVSSVQTTVHSVFPDSLAPQPADVADRVDHIKRGIARIAPHVPAATPFVVITGAAPGGNTQLVYETMLHALDELATFAKKQNVRVAFEPLNPVLFNTDTAIWGLDRALELVARVDNANLGICLDTWNVFETPSLHDVIRQCAERIFLVQISDWRRPRSGADRRSLGDGIIPNARIVKTVAQTGYTGPYILEIFSAESLPNSLWKSDLEQVLLKNKDAFDALYHSNNVSLSS